MRQFRGPPPGTPRFQTPITKPHPELLPGPILWVQIRFFPSSMRCLWVLTVPGGVPQPEAPRFNSWQTLLSRQSSLLPSSRPNNSGPGPVLCESRETSLGLDSSGAVGGGPRAGAPQAQTLLPHQPSPPAPPRRDVRVQMHFFPSPRRRDETSLDPDSFGGGSPTGSDRPSLPPTLSAPPLGPGTARRTDGLT